MQELEMACLTALYMVLFVYLPAAAGVAAILQVTESLLYVIFAYLVAVAFCRCVHCWFML
jgi:hypothetical protein